MRLTLLRYLAAPLAAVIALVIRLALDPLLGNRIPFTLSTLAVAAVGLYCGFLPGLLTTLLSAALGAYFILEPRGSFAVHNPELQAGLVVFLATSAVLLVLTEMQRRTKSELLRSQDAEKLHRESLLVTLNSIGDGVIATDIKGRVTFLNQVASDLTGWTQQEATGQPIETVFDIRNEETGAQVQNPVTRAIQEGLVVGLANHTVLISKKGRQVPISDSGAPIKGPDGVIRGAVLVFRNDERERAQQAEMLERQRMIDCSHDAIIFMDQDRHIKFWNRGAAELYGWDAREAHGQVTHDLLKTSNSMSMSEVDQLLRERTQWDGELIHTTKDGRKIIVESRHVLLRDGHGQIRGILEINRDATARKATEAALRESEERLRMVLGAAALGVWDLDLVGHETWRSIEHDRIFGYPELLPEWRYEDFLNHVVEEDRLEVDRQFHEAVGGGTVLDFKCRIRRTDGAMRWIWVQARLQGKDRMLGVVQDITQVKQAEEDLRQRERRLFDAQRLESLGLLAGGIAHDFNNLLTGIIGNASLLLEEAPEGSSTRVFAEGVQHAAERAAKLTQQMLAYSGRGRFVVEPLDLSKFIRETTSLIYSSMPRNVELELRLAEDLPLVEADVAQMQQLIMNLAINGGEAIGPEGGRVSITTSAVITDETYLTGLALQDPIRPGTYVVIDVEDNGCGMDERTQERIFDPFFTTKFTGRGLGLAAVQGIVRGHAGAIKIYSRPGEGTRFRVLLPASAVSRILETAGPKVQDFQGSGTVLVIDDEAIVRDTASAALRRLGYSAVLAEDGEKGVATFRAMRGIVSAVLLDMTMPGISTEETLRRLREIDGDAPILLSSGFSELEAARRFKNDGISGFLQKPYTVAMLAGKLKTVIMSDS